MADPLYSGTTKTLLIVYHSMTGGTRQMVEAAARGAAAEPAIRVRLLPAPVAQTADLLGADGYIFGTPENLAAMAGLMKDFFDRTYYPALDRINGRPYAMLICAGSDGHNAARQVERIATGWRLKTMADPLIVCTPCSDPGSDFVPEGHQARRSEALRGAWGRPRSRNEHRGVLASLGQDRATLVRSLLFDAMSSEVKHMRFVMTAKRPTMLMILDGWGWREDWRDNAIRQAQTPNFDRLWSSCPHAFLQTSGLDVGLPDGQMGNSEVGHLNLGGGRVVMQDLPRISRAIADGSIVTVLAETGLVAQLRETAGTCHLLGLISPGGVHSHQDHAVALAKILVEHGIPAVLHAFTDGRDTPPSSALEYVRALENAIPKEVTIATVCGRYFAMDRDFRWERVSKAFAAMVHGQGTSHATAEAAITEAYAQNTSDEFVPPSVIGSYRGMQSGDGLLSFNFRADRIRQLLDALLNESFDGFDRGMVPQFAIAAGMTSYSAELDIRMKTLFPPQALSNGLGETVSKAGRRQVRMAETEKYPHVTYFFNGGEEAPYPGEDRIMVPSPKVATYDHQPEMSAPELTARAVEVINSGAYDLIVLNFANPDMVGHTGALEATIKAVETVDDGIGQIVLAIQRAGGLLLVTADHGNCELMRDPATGAPHTAHTTNKVPVILMSDRPVTLVDGRLADVAPTLLALMGIAQPHQMSGHSLLRDG